MDSNLEQYKEFWQWAKHNKSHWFNPHGHVNERYEMPCDLAQSAWLEGWKHGSMYAHGINEQDIADTMPPRQGMEGIR